MGEIEITVARQKLFDQDCTPIAEISVLASVRSEQGNLRTISTSPKKKETTTPPKTITPSLPQPPQTSTSGHTVKSLTQWEERIRAKERELDRTYTPSLTVIETHSRHESTGTLNERLTKERQSIRRIASKRAAALDARDKERAMILSQASEKYENLEKELRRALEEVERRERALRNERSVLMSEVKEKMDALKAESDVCMDVEQRKQLERDRVQDFVCRLQRRPKSGYGETFGRNRVRIR